MNTITEKELKDRCTPEFIKWLCELAEGFELDDNGEFIDGIICPDGCEYEFEDITKVDIIFSLIIRRAVDGWNKQNANGISTHYNCILYNSEMPKLYKFKNYQEKNLTQPECAMLHCMLDIFEEN